MIWVVISYILVYIALLKVLVRIAMNKSKYQSIDEKKTSSLQMEVQMSLKWVDYVNERESICCSLSLQ